MKRKELLIFASLLMAFALNASAEGYGVFMEIDMKNSEKYHKVNRAPKRISLDVVYDTDSQCVTVNGDEGMEVEVFLYNSLGEVEDYSSSLNTTLSVSSLGIHRIHIEGEDWVANGTIEN
ncbi:MAG: hypothetical protein NC453_24810 [Muribaculum sp.]|nr:hypothetical protein [Muribaculum sp.]